ncbi:hypothetical protein [Clostridium butyricum]|uniref:hypothetical protein n=1 Tax=Clostridium butyricum TaxID=1492 RepID=UPI00374F8DAF
MELVGKIHKTLKEKYDELYELLKSLMIGCVSIIAVTIVGKLLNFFITIFRVQTEQNIKAISFIDTWSSVIIFFISTVAGIIGFAGKIYYKTKYQIKNSKLKDQSQFQRNKVKEKIDLIPDGIENLQDHVAKIHLDAASKIGSFDPED